MSKISRREFFKEAAVVGGAAALAASVGNAAQVEPAAASATAPVLRTTEWTAPHFAVIETNPIAGAIDMHLHSGPDNVRRAFNSIELAARAKSAGMAGVVLYHHQTVTHNLAVLARYVVPGIGVWGGIALNYPVGGINSAAVDMAVSYQQGGAECFRYVKMPTQSAGNNIAFSANKEPQFGEGEGLWVMGKDGKLNPQVTPILKTLAKNDLLLMSGHINPKETLVLFAAAKAEGVKKMQWTHATLNYTKGTLDQLKQAVALGAFIELNYLNVRSAGAVDDKLLTEVVDIIKAVGAAHVILATDLGQATNPIPSEGLHDYVTKLLAKGVSKADMDLMIRQNPATQLGLDSKPAV
jgi:hypothetical protein